MKMAKTLVLAIVATGIIGTGSAVAGPGDPLQGVIISLRGETTGTAKPNRKKRPQKASVSRKRRARNAERRRQRQLQRERAKLAEEQQELLEMFVVAIEEGDEDLALEIFDELTESQTLTAEDPVPPTLEGPIGPLDLFPLPNRPKDVGGILKKLWRLIFPEEDWSRKCPGMDGIVGPVEEGDSR